MCIPNKILSLRWPTQVCPYDGLPHFSVDFVVGKYFEMFTGKEIAIREDSYEADVHFNYDEDGNVLSIDVCLIAPMPQEKTSAWLEEDDPLKEEHSESEREDARIAALFGIKKYG